MVDPMTQAHSEARTHPQEDCILVLQGGGALGAYQAGVFESLVKTWREPSWVAGISIGAINAALIVGNPVSRRVERLRAFWELVSSSVGPPVLAQGFGSREGLNLSLIHI
jgi:NTE family protein